MKILCNVTLILAVIAVHSVCKAQNHSLFGYVKEKSSGESLIGATVLVDGKMKGVASNNYGFYSITLSSGMHHISYSYVGYQTVQQDIELINDTLLNIELQSLDSNLGEVAVVASRTSKISNTEMSSQFLDIAEIKKLPATMGEIDIVKALQLLPGVQATNDGLTNLSVRGGSFDQNLFLLDDAPVYNPSHALGFFSVFNSDAIKSVKIYKATFPARYGGRLSSIIDIYMKEGNYKQWRVSGGFGLIASRLNMEGPIDNGNGSFMLAGRYSYAGTTVNLLGHLGQQLRIESLDDFNKNNEINFYDLNAKVNYNLGTKDRLYLSAYSGSDHFYYYAIDDNSTMDWGNVTGTARWNHIFNSRLFSNTMLIYSTYNYSYILKDDARHFKWKSKLKEFDLKSDFDFYLNTSNHIKFGWVIENHNYFPGEVKPRDDTSITKPFTLDKQRAVIASVYASNNHRICDKLVVEYGMRYSGFFLLGENTVYSYSPSMDVIDSVYYGRGELVKFYQGIEPRLSINYRINDESSIKLSYAYTLQFQHLIGNSSVGFPSDVWVPSSTYIKPQSADQFAVGYYQIFDEHKYEFSVETFYREMHNIIDYRDNADLFLNPHIETQVLSGRGKSYGLEAYVEKRSGRLNGWMSYTLSKTTKQIDGINNNDAYPATYDKRHSLAVVLSYTLSPRWSVSSIFKLSSGGWITVPAGTFNFSGAAFNYYTSRNGYKMPMCHRLDLAFTYQPKTNKKSRWSGEWNFGVYNLYNRKNIFSLYVRQEDNDLQSSKAYKMYLYGITPFITYNFKF
jgi:hypothetical protein